MSPINGYHIDSLLGGGSYGIVVKAEKAGQYYALKLYSDDYLTHKMRLCSAIDLFKRETEILKCIQYPQIPGCIDFFVCENMYCLVQEYVPGNTLSELINQGHRYVEERVREIIFDLLKILSFLHMPSSNKPAIIHHDLRLSNLLLSGDDLFLIDFGLAHRIQNNADEIFLTRRIQFKFADDVSPSYAKMRNDLSIQSDLFGAGVVAVDLFINSAIADASTAWEQRIAISPSFKSFVRRLLGIEKKFMSCTEAIDHLIDL